jgi:acyl-CoA thioesterase-1
MRSPENWGPDYRAGFDAIFPALAQQHGAIFYPFFLDAVATDRTLNLDDGLHPNAKGIAVIVEKILPYAEQLVERAAARRPGRAGGHADTK